LRFTRKAAALARVLPTLLLSCERNASTCVKGEKKEKMK
jgi:hypothetical protein